MVKNINFAEFKKNVIGERQTCIVKFYSDGCYLCVGLAPLYEKLSSRYEDKVIFYKVDTVKETELTDIFKMDGVPTIYFFYKGNYGEIPYPYDSPDELTGYKEAGIIEYIDERIGNA